MWNTSRSVTHEANQRHFAPTDKSKAHYAKAAWDLTRPLQWRHNVRDGVSNHQPHHCLLNRLFRSRSKKTSKLRVSGLTGECPAQMASNADTISIWWRHHADAFSTRLTATKFGHIMACLRNPANLIQPNSSAKYDASSTWAIFADPS